jgi:probable HAF family extracellular repeat protein
VEAIFPVVLSNALVALALALLALTASMLFRGPQVAHWLWLLVLLKLLTPPVIQRSFPWKTARSSAATIAAAPAAIAGRTATGANGSARSERNQPEVAGSPPVQGLEGFVEARANRPPGEPLAREPLRVDRIALVAWFGVAGLMWISTCLAIHRFGRSLRACVPAGAELQDRVRDLAKRLGMSRPPSVWISPEAISPLVWAVGVRPRLVLPGLLWGRLDDDQRDALLLHELAHLRRRDHWVRFLEIAAMGLYWWHPVVWWARRALREAEEQCCDDWVIWALPEHAKAYARTLLAAVDFLAESKRQELACASGLIEGTQLKRRLVRILDGGGSRRLPHAGRLSLIGLSAMALVAGLRVDTSNRRYQALELGTLGGRSTDGIKLNARGQVVGISDTGALGGESPREPSRHAFLTAPGRRIDRAADDLDMALAGPGRDGQHLWPSDINAAGQIVLTRYDSGHNPDWKGSSILVDGTRIVDLDPERSGGDRPTCVAINDRGQMVGTVTRPISGPDRRQPWITQPVTDRLSFRAKAGQPIDLVRDDLGHLGGTDLSRGVYQTLAWDINASGQVVGDSLALDGWHHAFRTGPNRPIDPATDDLGTFGGKNSSARGINAQGQVVGSASLPGDRSHAFRTRPNRPIDPATDDLGTLGGTFSSGTAINNLGEVVGLSETADHQRHAFLHDGSRMFDLNTRVVLGPGWFLEQAVDINDSGQILAIAVDAWHLDRSVEPTHRTHVLTPLPDRHLPLLVLVGAAATASGLALIQARRAGALPWAERSLGLVRAVQGRRSS